MFIFREMEQDETRNSDRKGIFMTISTNYQCWNRSDTCGAEEMLLLYAWKSVAIQMQLLRSSLWRFLKVEM